MKVKDLISVGSACLALLMASGTQKCFAKAGSTAVTCQGIWSGKLISNSSAGSATFEAQFFQNGAAVSGAASATQGVMPHSGDLTGTINASGNVSITINMGSFGNLSAALTVDGSNLSGTYTRTLSNGTQADKGTVAMNLQPGLTTVNVNGVYIGIKLSGSSGMQVNSAVFFLFQSGNNVYVSTIWNGAYVYNGTGTIIGNTLTFEITQESFINGTPNVMNGSAAFSGKSMTGVSVNGPATDPVESDIAFSAEYLMPV